ncbi:MAG TPA: hypothetical protein VK153_00835 [Candidatus Paceibacterota bacterium]|nr:hypothetical protein [Candidatus Paceibacterota bacterium]
MANKKENKKMSAKTAVGIGAGIVALSAAAYILFGPNGKKNRKAIKGWAVKMKGEVIEQLEKAKTLTEPLYNKIIDKVKAKYSKLKDIDPEELRILAEEIKKQWKVIQKEGVPKKNSKKA